MILKVLIEAKIYRFFGVSNTPENRPDFRPKNAAKIEHDLPAKA